MKPLITILLALLLLLQYILWFGHGGLLEIWQMSRAVEAQALENSRVSDRNRALEGEVQGLKQGLDAVEERARAELGMISEGETFHQLVE